MKIVQFFYFCLVLGLVLTACKTNQVIQQDKPATKPTIKTAIQPSSELRGLLISSKLWDGKETEEIKSILEEIMTKASEARYNAVYFEYNQQIYSSYSLCMNAGKIDPEFDILGYTLGTAQRKGLRFYLMIDLLLINEKGTRHEQTIDSFYKNSSYRPIDSTWLIAGQYENPMDFHGNKLLNPALPQVKSYLKQAVRCITENYNIDGFSFDQRQYTIDMVPYDNITSEIFKSDSPEIQLTGKQWFDKWLTDLVEDVVVETMLIKPYLINSAIIPSGSDSPIPYLWLNDGIVDMLIPEIQNKENSSSQNLSDFWDVLVNRDSIASYIYPMIMPNDGDATGLSNINFEHGGQGMIWAHDNQESVNDISDFSLINYNEDINFPDSLKKISPEEVIGLDISSLTMENPTGHIVYFPRNNKTKIPDSNGIIGFISLDPDSIEFKINDRKINLVTQRWAIPYRYKVQSDNSVVRESPWVEFRRTPSIYTNNQEYHLLCKTEPETFAWIGNESLKVYKTGIFFDKITLDEGQNRVRATVMTQDSLSAFYECEFNYDVIDEAKQPYPLWIDEKSVLPKMDLELMPEDVVQVSFNGSLEQEATVVINPNGLRINCSRENFNDFSVYKAEVPLRKLNAGIPHEISLEISSMDSLNNPAQRYTLQNRIMVKELENFPLVKVTDENTRLTYNLGPVRLGGPIRSELGSGVILKTNGKMGNNYRIRLNRVEDAMIRQDDIEVLPRETVQPSFFITNMSCAPTFSADILSIPYLEPIPYAVYPDPDQNRIVITLFGAKTSSTWISHRKGLKIIDKVTWQQTTPETYEIYVNLKSPNIWGYEIKPEGKRLVLRIKNPPTFSLENSKPLAGLKIAIEAGHGGHNTGAVGLSGLLEKDINLDLSFKLGKLCQSKGADVVQVRESDKYMTLTEKRDVARNSNADMLISIHANAAGTSRGYLRVPGTSTYYNNPFWAPLAETIYDRLLETGLKEFGVVGSFNYTVIRVSQMPSILVEQAFMTHAEDEEKLADSDFRQQMAEKIYEGILDYLEIMNE